MNEAMAALVRRHDPDRFLTTLFAPAAQRDALLTLYAFNHELARAREVVSEPPLALIRLHWWREVVEGERRRHEVASPLSEAIAAGTLHAADLLALIDARDVEAYGDFETLAEWRAWVLAGAGGLAVAAGRALGAPEPEVLRPYGAAYGVSGLLRASGVLAARGRCLLPHDLLAGHGLTPEGFVHEPGSAAARAVLADVARQGRVMVEKAERTPRAAVAAALPAVLALRDFTRWPHVAIPRRLSDRLAVIVAGLRGKV